MPAQYHDAAVTGSPRTREEIISALQQQEGESVAYWNAFDIDTFFRPIGASWSPAETVRHLIKSTRPVVKALGMNRLLLRVMFGRPRRSSMSFEELRDRYLQGLAEGAQAGRFAPTPRTEKDPAAGRSSIMNQFNTVHRELRNTIGRWPEDKLDRLQLPHPALGKLTVREMLLFTLYHHRHHIGVVERRLQENRR